MYIYICELCYYGRPNKLRGQTHTHTNAKVILSNVVVICFSLPNATDIEACLVFKKCKRFKGGCASVPKAADPKGSRNGEISKTCR